MKAPNLLLFDGVCNVCNAAVNFVLDRDHAGVFRFASLQSEIGQRTCREHGIPQDVSTIVLVEEGRAYTESTAVLRIARRLGRGWPLLSIFYIVPKPLRDAAYRYFAANRYRWFGKSDTCRIPTPEIRARFLD